MKIFFIFIIISLFFNKVNSIESYIVLKINNNIITNLDIENEQRYLIALNQGLREIDKKTRMKLAKNSIIKETIKKEELLNYFDLNQENKFIDEIIENFYQKLGFNNEKEFINYLTGYNLSYPKIRKKISIEAAWNDLIYQKFLSKIEIDEKKIKDQIEKLILNKKKENIYLISEILFNIEKTENINKKYNKIKTSINEIGFKSSANIYSISDSAKLGGQIGWVNENQLSEIIKKEIKILNIGEITKPITIPGGLLIIHLDNKKIQEEKLNFDKEYEKRLIFEKNKQLDKFSKIYFSKIKKNSLIDEK